MGLIYLIIVLIIVGVLMYLVNNYVPMAPAIKTVLNIAVVVVVILWLLSIFGLNIPVNPRR